MSTDMERILAEQLAVIREEIARLRCVLEGGKGNNGLGLLAEHKIMWRLHVWILCTLSGGAGVLCTLLISKFVK